MYASIPAPSISSSPSFSDNLDLVGWDPVDPLEHCQGDCDRDEDCGGVWYATVTRPVLGMFLVVVQTMGGIIKLQISVYEFQRLESDQVADGIKKIIILSYSIIFSY